MERRYRKTVPFIKHEEVPSGKLWQGTIHHHLFSITLKGGARYTFPEKEVKIREGDLLHFQPGTFQHWKAGPEGWEVYYLIIDLPTDLQILLPPDNLAKGMGRIKLYGNAFDESKKAFRVMDQWWEKTSSLKDQMLLNQIEFVLLQIRNLYNTTLLDPRIEKACNFLNSCLKTPTSLDQVVKAAGLSKPRLNTLFNEAFGVPPLQYLKNLRMERAAQLLLFSSLDIDYIATSLGYLDRKYFDKLFKRHWKVTPFRYRKQNQ